MVALHPIWSWSRWCAHTLWHYELCQLWIELKYRDPELNFGCSWLVMDINNLIIDMHNSIMAINNYSGCIRFFFSWCSIEAYVDLKRISLIGIKLRPGPFGPSQARSFGPHQLTESDTICYRYMSLNTLRPKQNGHHFANNMSKYISWMKIFEFRFKFHRIIFLVVQ